MLRRPALAIPLSAALLLAASASVLAEGPGGGPPPGAGGPAPNPPGGPAGGPPGRAPGPPKGGAPAGPAAGAPAEGEAPEDDENAVDVKGNRFRVHLKNGSAIVGVLPHGLVWEKEDEYGSFTEAKETDPGSGLRLFFVLDLEGEIFLRREDMSRDEQGKLMVRDLGELTEEQKAVIRAQILKEKRKVLIDRENAIREELARLKAEEAAKAAEAGKGEGGAKGGPAGAKKEEDAEAEAIRRGEALLEKFPPAEWGEEKIKEIVTREVVNGIFRSDLEREFIDNFDAWKAALERREKAEQEKKETPPEGGGE